MIAILRIIVILGGVAGAVLFFLRQLAGSGQWRKGISEKDLNLLKDAIVEFNSDLVEIDQEELPLLSLKQKRRRLKRNSRRMLAGTFQSIYEENLCSYAVMNYQQGQHLILVNTTDREFVYRVKSTGTDIYANGSHVGILNTEGNLTHPINKDVLATIDNRFSPKHQVISKGGKNIASVLNPLVKYEDHERVFHNLELENEDKLILLSLTFLNMIERTQ